MKASELINSLQQRIEIYGDLDVILWDIDNEDTTSVSSLVSVSCCIPDDDNCRSCIELEFE
jgi:hypothetical protein